FALTVSLAADSVQDLSATLPKVRAALLQWKGKRKNQCAMIQFSVVSDPKHHAAIVALFNKIYREDQVVSPILQAIETQVSLLNNDGDPVREYTLGQPAAEVPLDEVEALPELPAVEALPEVQIATAPVPKPPAAKAAAKSPAPTPVKAPVR